MYFYCLPPDTSVQILRLLLTVRALRAPTDRNAYDWSHLPCPPTPWTFSPSLSFVIGVPCSCPASELLFWFLELTSDMTFYLAFCLILTAPSVGTGIIISLLSSHWLFFMYSLRWYLMYVISLWYPSAVQKGIQHLEIFINSSIVHCHFLFLILELKETNHKIISLYSPAAMHEMKVGTVNDQGTANWIQHGGYVKKWIIL